MYNTLHTSAFLHVNVVVAACMLNVFLKVLCYITAVLPGFSETKVMHGVFLIVIFSSGLKMLSLHLSSTDCKIVSIVL